MIYLLFYSIVSIYSLCPLNFHTILEDDHIRSTHVFRRQCGSIKPITSNSTATAHSFRDCCLVASSSSLSTSGSWGLSSQTSNLENLIQRNWPMIRFQSCIGIDFLCIYCQKASDGLISPATAVACVESIIGSTPLLGCLELF